MSDGVSRKGRGCIVGPNFLIKEYTISILSGMDWMLRIRWDEDQQGWLPNCNKDSFFASSSCFLCHGAVSNSKGRAAPDGAEHYQLSASWNSSMTSTASPLSPVHGNI